MTDAVYITREGYEKLRTELENLNKLKAELSIEIGEAMAQGDLRENAGYTAAKERQAGILKRIDETRMKLRNAQLIETLKVDKSEARIGATVTLSDTATGAELSYTLAGSQEASPENGSISIESPLGRAILGHKLGDEFPVTLPRGERKFRLTKLEYK